MRDEVFGPASLVVVCRDVVDMLRVAECSEGQLTATLHADHNDRDLAYALLPVPERNVGRILFSPERAVGRAGGIVASKDGDFGHIAG